MVLKILALALTALIFAPSGAHLFELPHKIGLDRADYFTVQSIYAGWALFAVPVFAAIAANGALAWRSRRTDVVAARWAWIAAGLVCLSLAIFFAWVLPANRATLNWTHAPQDWRAWRRAWEFGHAAGAVASFAAVLATARAIAR